MPRCRLIMGYIHIHVCSHHGSWGVRTHRTPPLDPPLDGDAAEAYATQSDCSEMQSTYIAEPAETKKPSQ